METNSSNKIIHEILVSESFKVGEESPLTRSLHLGPLGPSGLHSVSAGLWPGPPITDGYHSGRLTPRPHYTKRNEVPQPIYSSEQFYEVISMIVMSFSPM